MPPTKIYNKKLWQSPLWSSGHEKNTLEAMLIDAPTKRPKDKRPKTKRPTDKTYQGTKRPKNKTSHKSCHRLNECLKDNDYRECLKSKYENKRFGESVQCPRTLSESGGLNNNRGHWLRTIFEDSV